MSQPQRLVAALDLGSTKVVAAIAEVTGDARDVGARILGVASEKTAGIRRGVVRDIEETTRAIDKAMKSAQRMAGVEVGSAYCGIAGEHVAGRSSHGMVSVTGDEIRTSDVARVNDMASNISFGRDHELLHAIPQDYLIDQQGGINEPIGAGFEPLVPESDVFELPSTPGQGARNAQRRVLAHIMHMRLQEVLEYALDEITRAGYHQRLPAGVILTGGGALTPGIVELAREVFAMPARCGIPGQRLRGLADSVESPRMAVSAGLVLYGARQVATSGGFGTGARKSPAVEKVLAPVKRWLQDFF
jgi:cell division protein FtsA